MAVQLTYLCIISGDPLRSRQFIATLQASLGPQDHLEVIMDRRHGGSCEEPDLKEDRRRQPHVDLELKANGFAIASASIDPTEDRTERFFPMDDADVNDEDEERLEQPSTLVPKLLGVLSGLALAALVLLLSGQIAGQSLWSQLFTGPLSGGPDQPPGQTNQSVAPAKFPAVTKEPVVAETRPQRTETSPPARRDSESPSAGGTASTRSGSPRDADRLTPKPRETRSPSEVTGTESRAPSVTPGQTSPPPGEPSTPTRGAAAPAKETAAPPRAGTGQGESGGRSRLGATARQSPSAASQSNQDAGALPPRAATPKATPPQVVGSHRAELVHEPVSRGWGDSYAVRLLDPEGRPMVVGDVLLVARMADGTVENVAMGALPEPGTYRGTVPTGRSTPVNLRVRVTTADESVEIPVKP